MPLNSADIKKVKASNDIVIPEALKTIATAESVEKNIEAENEKLIQYSFTMTAAEKEQYKIFCAKHHISMKAFISLSMDYMLRQVENDKLLLTASGVYNKAL